MNFFVLVNETGRINAIYKTQIEGINTLEIELSEEVIKNPQNYAIVNNKVIYQEQNFDLLWLGIKKENFRAWRSERLLKYDILRLNVFNEDIDPNTNTFYQPITEEEKQWRVSVLNFTNQITKDTTPNDYPTPSLRLQ